MLNCNKIYDSDIAQIVKIEIRINVNLHLSIIMVKLLYLKKIIPIGNVHVLIYHIPIKN